MQTAEGDTIVRRATPTLDLASQTVRVDYAIERSRGDEVIATVRESHTVRFLFVQEIRQMLDGAGLELLALGPFMDLTREPTASDWYVSVAARRR